LREGRTGLVEVAAASGLDLVEPPARDPEAASSRGTGELIAAAIEAGATRILVAAGGSATTDGGQGAIDALEAAGGPRDTSLEVLCDTTVSFERAADVFAPQKGASPKQAERLTARLVALAAALPRDPRGRAMSGAAGGLSGGLWAAFGARLLPGAATVLGLLGFDQLLEDADVVITGEGRLDATTREGKLVGEIARRSRAERVPLHAIVGGIAVPGHEIAALGLASVAEAGNPEAIAAAAERIALTPGG
jgi:glycerate kinase